MYRDPQVIDKRRLNMEVEDKDLLLEQLRKEIEILQRLSHPNIVAFEEVRVCTWMCTLSQSIQLTHTYNIHVQTKKTNRWWRRPTRSSW